MTHVTQFRSSEGDQYVVAVVRRTGDWVETYFDGPFPDADQAVSIAEQERRTPNTRTEVMGVR